MARNFSKEVDDYVKNSSDVKAKAIIDWTQSATGLITKDGQIPGTVAQLCLMEGANSN